MKCLAFAVVGGLLSASLAAQGASVYSLQAPTPAQRLWVGQHFDPLECGACGDAAGAGPSLEFVVQPAQKALLRSLLPTAAWVRDVRPFQEVMLEMQAVAGLDNPPTGYYTVAEIEAAIDAEVAAYPGLAAKVDLTALPGGVPTHQGRSIFALKVSDNVASDEDEPAIVIAAQHHARELNAPHMVIGAMQRLLAAYATDPALQAVVDGYEVWFVPMVNPDGVEHVWTVDQYWRKNRRFNGGTSYGVDLNRNYPFLWGQCGASTLTSSQIYRGPAPGSEPETATMRNLVAWLRPEFYLDFHSYGREVLRTYAPCASVHPAVAGLIEHYVDDLRQPMGYQKRDPSASGEAPEDHWSHGTLSLLVEVGTAFQPAFSSTVAEEALVWPGIEHAITTFRPAVRGHVRSSLGALPLAATITYTPATFTLGEVCLSRARDGRYGLWLPPGNWNVTWSAPGHQSRTLPVSVAAYDQPLAIDVLLDPSSPGVPVVAAVGSGQLGTSVQLTYTSPADAGRVSWFGWSLGTTPGLDLGGQRVIPLNVDPLFYAAWSGNPFLAPTWGVLDAGDQANATLSIPNVPWLVGLTSYVAGVTFDPAWQAGVRGWSQPVAITIVP